jgi:hypothetical protein
MNDPKQVSPRARLQELLAIPERQRTDAEWDELHELEISLAPVNRGGRPEHGEQRNAPQHAGRPGGAPHGGSHGVPRGGPQGGKPGRRFRKRMRTCT